MELLLYQRANHNKHWVPTETVEPPQDFSKHPSVIEAEAQRLEREVAPVMQATPGEVKHKWPQEKVC